MIERIEKMNDENKGYSLDEILAMDTSEMSLDEMISMLRCNSDEEFYDAVMQLRLRHEEDTGEDMDDDEISEQEEALIAEKFPDLAAKVNNLSAAE